MRRTILSMTLCAAIPMGLLHAECPTQGKISVKKAVEARFASKLDLSKTKVAITGPEADRPTKGMCLYYFSIADKKSGKELSPKYPVYEIGGITFIGHAYENGRDVSALDYRKANAEYEKRKLEERRKAREMEKKRLSPKLLSFVERVKKGEFAPAVTIIDGGNPKGDEIAIFADPQCPACRRFEKTVFPLVLKNLKRVYIVDYPLSFHKEAEKRAFYGKILMEEGVSPKESLERSMNEPYSKVVKTVKGYVEKNPKKWNEWKRSVDTIKKESGVAFTPTIVSPEGLIYQNEFFDKYVKGAEK